MMRFCLALLLVSLLAQPGFARNSKPRKAPQYEAGLQQPAQPRDDRYYGAKTVITRKMLDDYNATTLCDALRFVPGLVASGC